MLLSLLMSFSFMNTVFAEGDLEFSISANLVSGSTTVAAGSEAVIDLGVVSSSNVDSCIFEITHDSGIEFVSRAGMNNYVVGTNDNNILVYRATTDVGFTSGQNILELKYKINSAGKLTIKTTKCTSSTDTSGSYKDIDFDFKVTDASEDASLKSLVVNGGVLSPTFTSSQTNYVIDLDSTSFSLELIANNTNYQDKIVVTDANGVVLDPSNITFSDISGQAMMDLTVTVNGVSKYTLLVKYEQEGLDNSLSSLKVYGKEVALQKGKYDYKVIVSKDASSVKIAAELVDSENFKFAENNGPTTFQIPNATNVYPLIIEPKSSSLGATGVTYTITVVKEGMVDTGNSSSGNNQNTGGGNVSANPTTSGISMFIMSFILIVSLIGSLYLYRKNIEGYNK